MPGDTRRHGRIAGLAHPRDQRQCPRIHAVATGNTAPLTCSHRSEDPASPIAVLSSAIRASICITNGVRWFVALRADPGLPGWSVRLIDELDATDRRVNELARWLSPKQLNWKPAGDLWSVGQCLQHLYAANDV